MKVRHGFVSNSSSSSFCIYGVHIEHEQLSELQEKLNVADNTEDFMGVISDQYGVDAYFCGDNYSCYIGKSWADIKDDETGLQFKTKIQDSIHKLLNTDTKCETIEETWYN